MNLSLDNPPTCSGFSSKLFRDVYRLFMVVSNKASLNLDSEAIEYILSLIFV